MFEYVWARFTYWAFKMCWKHDTEKKSSWGSGFYCCECEAEGVRQAVAERLSIIERARLVRNRRTKQ